MKKILHAVLFVFLTMFLTFAQEGEEQFTQPQEQTVQPAKRSIVVYFSHKGETFGLKEMKFGNTQMVAIVLAKLTNSDIFEIEPIKTYPTTLKECRDVAKKEKASKLRVQYKNDIDLSGYDTIYFGYPIWWQDMPMISYTFLENHDLNNKKIVPFVTHSGYGVGYTVEKIHALFPDAEVETAFDIEGVITQYDPRQMLGQVMEYLKSKELIQ